MAERDGPTPSIVQVTAPVGEDESHALVRQFRLRVDDGPDAGATHTASRQRTVVGTHRSADLVLHDPTLSRFHCEIAIREGHAEIRDLGSRNGTLVDGVCVHSAVLHEGACLALGRTRIRFELGEEHVRLPLSARRELGRMVGRSRPMRAVFAILERAARGDATVLLQGETGTGKEVAARAIHAESARRGGPFVVVDCGAIPGPLLESELFGHERGAFTGADRMRVGAFESASRGTLFLDEIGELGLDLQPKLLRALESREIRRVGGDASRPVDVRIVAATNRDLRVEVNARRFRADLFYRLAVVEVTLPPLRERIEDIPLLVEAHLESVGAADSPEAEPLRAAAFLRALGRHPWAGNVRELRNHLDRCLALQMAAPLPASGADSMPVIDPSEPLKPAREKWLHEFERRYLRAILDSHEGNAAAAARAAGVDRKHFYRLLWKNQVRRDE